MINLSSDKRAEGEKVARSVSVENRALVFALHYARVRAYITPPRDRRWQIRSLAAKLLKRPRPASISSRDNR